MKIGIVSDTHSNIYALQAVLEKMDEEGVTMRVHCGDVVGYGPKPNETLELTLEKFHYIVMGNHDFGVINEESTWGFNPLAKEAIDWTRKKLTKENKDLIMNFEYGQKLNDMLFIHGSPNTPFEYLDTVDKASQAFGAPVIDFNYSFVGHTHVPLLWTNYGQVKGERIVVNAENKFVRELKPKSIVNVGSVGQPRDGDSRASFGIFDTDTSTIEVIKVEYPVDQTIAMMQREGFSERSWTRLMYGQ